MTEVNCPKCDADISDTYEGAEPDVGLMYGGWYCNACGLAVAEHDDEEPEIICLPGTMVEPPTDEEVVRVHTD